MSGLPMGFIIESIVSVLLALTLGYCVVLNRRLKTLHADGNIMRAINIKADIFYYIHLTLLCIKGNT